MGDKDEIDEIEKALKNYDAVADLAGILRRDVDPYMEEADDWFVRGPKEECEELEALEMDGLEDEEVPF